jgi:hydrogenase maturation protease
LQLAVPRDVQVVDGGLAGLDLLPFVEGAKRVVFVDAVAGFGRPGEPIVLRASEAAQGITTRYNHAAGLAYLLRVLPYVCKKARPEISVVGIEGNPDEEAIAAAAEMALRIAIRGYGAFSGGRV